ncbi:MAG: rRNA maturation RNase YbeY [Anaerolineales bacterium]
MTKAKYTVHLQIDPAFRKRVAAATLHDAAHAALTQQDTATGAVTIRITGDAELQRLNRDYLSYDYATDVLSFPSDENEDGVRYYGDLALSLPRAAAQAKTGGHSLSAELQLLVVHGVLHLLGHDHATKREQTRMWAAQAKILKSLGSEITGPTTSPPPFGHPLS